MADCLFLPVLVSFKKVYPQSIFYNNTRNLTSSSLRWIPIIIQMESEYQKLQDFHKNKEISKKIYINLDIHIKNYLKKNEISFYKIIPCHYFSISLKYTDCVILLTEILFCPSLVFLSVFVFIMQCHIYSMHMCTKAV